MDGFANGLRSRYSGPPLLVTKFAPAAYAMVIREAHAAGRITDGMRDELLWAVRSGLVEKIIWEEVLTPNEQEKAGRIESYLDVVREYYFAPERRIVLASEGQSAP